jgi:superfamily II DNA or RNA helicase
MCPCRDNVDRGIICAHVIALGLALIRRSTDPEIERKRIEEARKAARLAKVDEGAYLKRVPAGTPGAANARLRLELGANWAASLAGGRIPLKCWLEYQQHVHALDAVPRNQNVVVSQKDEALLFVLEDVSEGPAKGSLEVMPADLINILQLHVGKPLYQEGAGEALVVNGAPMQSVLRMDLDHENGELILMAHTELPFLKPGEFPLYITAGKAGWVYGAGNFWPLANVLPGPLRAIYEKPTSISRAAVPRFLQSEIPLLSQHIAVQTDLSIDLFTIEPATPQFRLVVRGSPASLAATLLAQYGSTTLVAAKPDPAGQFALPDPNDLLRYTVRNPAAEREALLVLQEVGLKGDVGDGLTPVVGCSPVLNFMGRYVPFLKRRGWQIELDGRAGEFMEGLRFATPVVHVADGGANEWFEVDFQFDDGQGGSLTSAEIQRALLKGESFVEKGGRTILLDATAIESMNDVFADCASGEGSRPGSFRLAGIYASYVKSSLNALDGVDVEASPAWVRRAEQQNRELQVEPVTLAEPLNTVLRAYQRDGVSWLRFLEQHVFGGILADEMGLGKTLQALAWLKMPRIHSNGHGQTPALIICPTSLVENWAEEARRFVPDLKVLTVSGGDRHEKWPELEKADIVVTSYALLRRDIDHYTPIEFSAAILDEAQHIKNKATQNALAAKRLKARHRLVLTGTPIENSVSDLWSIMDYLMPGYLGPHERFRQGYELAIARGGADAELAQVKLKRKLQPFLLRRMKRDVAKDLPPKIERVATCTLSPDQQLVYQEYLVASQRKIADLVSQQGFQRSRLEILKTLLRLRQVCCHLDLLKLPDLQPKFPSAKLDLFFELLDEACDAGHRVLVFSQFVSMLTILRAELDKRGLTYCYLDGATQERLKVVHEFNTRRDIPVFLISLKAGGTGLNLTGADMVIHYDPWWNPAVEDQATDRAYRIGQKRTVYSVKLIAKNTVEEKVLELQRRKQAVIDATLENDEQVMSKLTWEDIQELLSL